MAYRPKGRERPFPDEGTVAAMKMAPTRRRKPGTPRSAARKTMAGKNPFASVPMAMLGGMPGGAA